MRVRDSSEASHYCLAFVNSYELLVQPGSTSNFPVIDFSDACDSCAKRPKTGYCVHDVEKIFRGSLQFSEQFVKKEMRRWHPDRWVGRGVAQVQAQEIFTMLGSILEGEV